MNALIVDDSATARKIMHRIMESLEFDVEEAALGGEAQTKLSSTVYDVVLLDWNMPDIQGVDLVRQLRKGASGRHVPILMVTQNSEREHIIEALDAGVDEYVMKPFTRDALHEKLLLMGIVEFRSPGLEPIS